MATRGCVATRGYNTKKISPQAPKYMFLQPLWSTLLLSTTQQFGSLQQHMPPSLTEPESQRAGGGDVGI